MEGVLEEEKECWRKSAGVSGRWRAASVVGGVPTTVSSGGSCSSRRRDEGGREAEAGAVVVEP
jgi:hypothetical protein